MWIYMDSSFCQQLEPVKMDVITRGCWWFGIAYSQGIISPGTIRPQHRKS